MDAWLVQAVKIVWNVIIKPIGTKHQIMENAPAKILFLIKMVPALNVVYF